MKVVVVADMTTWGSCDYPDLFTRESNQHGEERRRVAVAVGVGVGL